MKAIDTNKYAVALTQNLNQLLIFDICHFSKDLTLELLILDLSLVDWNPLITMNIMIQSQILTSSDSPVEVFAFTVSSAVESAARSAAALRAADIAVCSTMMFSDLFRNLSVHMLFT